MDGARRSRFPHLTWLPWSIAAVQGEGRMVVSARGACHALGLEVRCRRPHEIAWIRSGRERRFTADAGTSLFIPADDEHHTFISDNAGHALEVILLPRGHLDAYLVSEECACPEWHLLLRPNDAIIRDCVMRLATASRQDNAASDSADDETARRLILRLAELCGGGRPDWHDDASVFARQPLGDLVSYIDAHLKIAPNLSDLAIRVGLSPSHFAKKFRRSTGLSLQRFINRRRIRASLDLLQDQSAQVSGVALDLGFSSQSHFSRLFRQLTGMTPAKYQRMHRPTVG